MNILVLNDGSSSVKFKLFDIKNETVLCGGLVEKIGEEISTVKFSTYREKHESVYQLRIENHSNAITILFGLLKKNNCVKNIDAIGHRIAHGADKFRDAVLFDKDTMSTIASLNAIAPLHNPVIVESNVVCNVLHEYMYYPLFYCQPIIYYSGRSNYGK